MFGHVMLVTQYIGHYLQEALVCLNMCHLVTVTCVFILNIKEMQFCYVKQNSKHALVVVIQLIGPVRTI